MKLLLLSYITSFKYGNTGLDYIARYIRDRSNYNVKIKYYHHHEDLDKIIQDIDLDYDVYGFSVFQNNYTLFKKVSLYIKSTNKNAVIIFGGQFVSMNYQEMINDAPMVDYFVLGDGEAPVKRILDHHMISNDYMKGDKNIAGKGDYIEKQNNVEPDVNRQVDFDYYENDSSENNHLKTHCIMTKSNICTGACTFCCSRKGKVVYKDTKRIVGEIEILAKRYGVRKFFLCDDDIFDIDGAENRSRLNDLFDRLLALKLNLAFSGFAKAKSICNPLNYPMLEKMSSLGFHHLFVGVDAGNEADRKLYNKRASLDEGIRAVQLLNSVGISPRYGMIFMNPYSTLETLRDNYRYLLKLKSSNYYHYGGLKVELLKDTKLLGQVQRDGLLTENYSFMNVLGYKFLHQEIQPIADFLDDEFLPRIDNIKGQFNTLKRKYELVRHINSKAVQYAPLIQQYEKEEFEGIKNYFYFLYECNDILYCREHLEYYAENMEIRAQKHKPLINVLNEMFLETPIERKS